MKMRWLKKLNIFSKRISKTTPKKYELIKNESEQLMYNEINKKLADIKELAENSGCSNLQQHHLHQVLLIPGALDKDNKDKLIELLRELDLKIKFEQEARISAYLRVPVPKMLQNTRTITIPPKR